MMIHQITPSELIKPTSQNSITVLKVSQPMNKKTLFKTLETNIIKLYVKILIFLRIIIQNRIG